MVSTAHAVYIFYFCYVDLWARVHACGSFLSQEIEQHYEHLKTGTCTIVCVCLQTQWWEFDGRTFSGPHIWGSSIHKENGFSRHTFHHSALLSSFEVFHAAAPITTEVSPCGCVLFEYCGSASEQSFQGKFGTHLPTRDVDETCCDCFAWRRCKTSQVSLAIALPVLRALRQQCIIW